MSNKRLTNSLQLPTAGQVIPRIGPLHHLISGSIASKLNFISILWFLYEWQCGMHLGITLIRYPLFALGTPNNGAINASLIHYYLTYSRSNSIANSDREMLKTVIWYLRVYTWKKKKEFWASDKAKFELMMLGHYKAITGIQIYWVCRKPEFCFKWLRIWVLQILQILDILKMLKISKILQKSQILQIRQILQILSNIGFTVGSEVLRPQKGCSRNRSVTAALRFDHLLLLSWLR